MEEQREYSMHPDGYCDNHPGSLKLVSSCRGDAIVRIREEAHSDGTVHSYWILTWRIRHRKTEGPIFFSDHALRVAFGPIYDSDGITFALSRRFDRDGDHLIIYDSGARISILLDDKIRDAIRELFERCSVV